MAREMKETGVPWIGQIPANWNLVRTKHCYLNHKEIAGDNADNYQRLALTLNGVVKRPKDDSTGLQPEAFNGYQVLRENELVFKLIDLANVSTSRVGYSPYTGIVSPAYIVLHPRDEDESRFGEYFFLSMWQREVFNHMGDDGVRSSLNASDLLDSPYVFVPSEEKKRIVEFLDAECARIDAVIEQTSASIEEYKKLKQAVITQAVTKGIREGREMKESGYDKELSIPNDWQIIDLKYLMTDIIDCPHETPNYCADGSYFVIRTADQDYASLRTDDNMFRLDQSEYENRIRRMPLNKDDIVYGREGERWGLACLVPESNKYCLGQRMMQFRCNVDKILPQFAVYALSSLYVHRQGEFDTFGSTSPHVNISTIRNYKIPIPNIEEQKEICFFLDREISKIDIIVSKKMQFLNEIEAYKKAMIFGYVTGKREMYD